MIHYVRYGIQLGYRSVKVSPFGPTAFKYHVGNVHVEYDSVASRVVLAMPGTGISSITIDSLQPNQAFKFEVGESMSSPWPNHACSEGEGTATTDSTGTL